MLAFYYGLLLKLTLLAVLLVVLLLVLLLLVLLLLVLLFELNLSYLPKFLLHQFVSPSPHLYLETC